jgi:hypothetical protein
MSAETLIDFTTRRKGSRTRAGRTIQVCPKCGRKGELSHIEAGKMSRNSRAMDCYTHKGTLHSGGLVFRVDDSCYVYTA